MITRAETERIQIKLVRVASSAHSFNLMRFAALSPTVITPTVITPTLINTPTMHPGLYDHILSNRNSKQL
jgi:hypothetical protein